MTNSKVLTRLLQAHPAVFKAAQLHPSRCILATAVGVAVLQEFGIQAQGVSVRVDLFNKAFVDWKEGGEPGGYPGAEAAGGYMLSAGYSPDELPANTVINQYPAGRGWDGHLVMGLTLAGEDLIVDLDLQQMNRPARGIQVPDAAVFAWKNGQATGRLPGGHVIAYAASPGNTTWQTAPDWAMVDRRTDLVMAVTRMVRKGRL